MTKYTCSVCGENDNPICTAIGTTTPHDCPYNLGDFKWDIANDLFWKCKKCGIQVPVHFYKCHTCGTLKTKQ